MTVSVPISRSAFGPTYQAFLIASQRAPRVFASCRSAYGDSQVRSVRVWNIFSHHLNLLGMSYLLLLFDREKCSSLMRSAFGRRIQRDAPNRSRSPAPIPQLSSQFSAQLGLGHQPPSDRHHLLLATGKLPTQHIGVSSRNGKNRTLRPSKDHSTKRKRSRTRLQLVLCDDWHGNTGCLVAQDFSLADQGSQSHPRGDFAPYRALFSDIPSSGIFRVVGGDLAPSLRFIEESSEY